MWRWRRCWKCGGAATVLVTVSARGARKDDSSTGTREHWVCWRCRRAMRQEGLTVEVP